MNDYFSFAQIWGYVALVTYVLAYLIHDDKKLKLAFSASNVFWILHYWMVDAQTAAVTTVIITLRNLLSLNAAEKPVRWKFWNAVFFSLCLVLAGALTWAGWTSVIAVAATIAVTWAMFFTTGIKMRLIFLATDIGWLAHALLVTSYSGMIYAIGSVFTNLYTVLHMRARSSAG